MYVYCGLLATLFGVRFEPTSFRVELAASDVNFRFALSTTADGTKNRARSST